MDINIGKKIKQLRKDAKLTQPELAKSIGVSKGIISFWENNINEPKATYIKSLAEFFNTTSDFLIGISNTEKANEQNKILNIYNQLNSAHKNLIIYIIEKLIEY